MRAVYLDTYLDASIEGAGYERWTNNPLTWNWNNYAIMAEYESYGPGFNLTKRIAGNLTTESDAAQAAVYGSPEEVFMTPTGEQPDVAWRY
jgi:pectinesterase